MNRKYVKVVYDCETQLKLRNWCIENGFNLDVNYSGFPQEIDDFEFHSTVIYSKNIVDGFENKIIEVNKTKVKPVEFRLFGEEENIPVLIIESEHINSLHSWCEYHGLIDYWEDYIPHISLSYSPIKDISNKKLPDFELYYDTIVIEDLIE